MEYFSKPLNYKTIDVYTHNKYKDFDYYIINFGCFPYVYLDVSKTKINSENFKELNKDITVHCGFSHYTNQLPFSETKSKFIVWDYGHPGDYFYSETIDNITGKMWTTKEISYECEGVIEQIIRSKYFKDNNLETIKKMSLDDFAKFLDDISSTPDEAPWYKWFNDKYCDNCSTCWVQYNEKPMPCTWCELNDDKCKFFLEKNIDTTNPVNIIKLWLSKEGENNDKS